jgi:hypothetical protein
MKNSYKSKVKYLGMAAVMLLYISGCGSEDLKPPEVNLDNILSFTAQPILSFSEVGDIYFSHLGYESVMLENGNIAIPDRQIPNITIINEAGELQKVIREGRGPGEIQDAYQFTKNTEGHIYTYDQDNDKLIEYDENFELVREMIPPNYENTSLLKAYPTSRKNELLFELTSYEYLQDETKNRENILVQFDVGLESYGEAFTLKAQPYARLYIDGLSVGATQVPYSYGNITAYNPQNQTLFVFDTASDRIAEINADFDTLRTISVNLPTEEISVTERDSMKAEYDDLRWDALKDLLPKEKAPVNKMLYQDGEFWMESNILGDTEMWLVVNLEGVITKIVHLPKESMLLHVSDEHLGVRLDDVTFALFTNPEPESLN